MAYPTGVDAVEGTEMKAYTVGEDAVVEFAEAGAYEVSVYTTAGEQVARKAAQLNAGNVVNVHLAKAGIYVLNVKKDGKTVRTVKQTSGWVDREAIPLVHSSSRLLAN